VRAQQRRGHRTGRDDERFNNERAKDKSQDKRDKDRLDRLLDVRFCFQDFVFGLGLRFFFGRFQGIFRSGGRLTHALQPAKVRSDRFDERRVGSVAHAALLARFLDDL
jgi:hypothetical protein